MHHALELARPWLESYGYPGLFFAVFVEGCGIPFPGQTGMMAAALLAREGDMSIAAVFAVTTIAAFTGNTLGYWIGLRWGKAPLERLAMAKHALATAEHAYVKYGGPIIVLARFFDGLRQLNGIVAGALGMPWHRFMIYNAIGAVLWCGVWGLGLYYAADPMMRLWHKMQPLHHLGWIAAAVIGLIGIYLLWRAWRMKRGVVTGSPSIVASPEGRSTEHAARNDQPHRDT
jgi:membrane protein DedA with SNARE-associated domain